MQAEEYKGQRAVGGRGGGRGSQPALEKRLVLGLGQRSYKMSLKNSKPQHGHFKETCHDHKSLLVATAGGS